MGLKLWSLYGLLGLANKSVDNVLHLNVFCFGSIDYLFTLIAYIVDKLGMAAAFPVCARDGILFHRLTLN